MARYLRFVAVVVLAAAAGCVNAPDSSDHATGRSQRPGIGGGEVTADDSAGGTHTVNGSIRVLAGQKAGEVDTVNGSIHVDENATLAEAHTINGSITLGSRATAEGLRTVNGRIHLDDGARVSHEVSSVNGALALGSGADVGGPLANVNGRIELKAAHIGGGIRTVNGDIDVGANSHIEGGILVEKPSMGLFGWTTTKPRIVIGPGAVVQGNLRFEREVQLYVSDKASIGPVSGATAVRFSGDNPPG